jgi:hypothetical protein
MSEPVFFPFIPSGMDWDVWNGNLIMFYSEEPIPYVTNENDWKLVAKNVSQLPTFEVYPVPDPDLYANWQDWAFEFTLIISGPTT